MPASAISGHTTVVATADLLSSEFGEEFIILNLRDGIYYGLDHVGARIWNLVRQPTTVTAVRDALVSEYEVDPAQAQEDLLRLLGDLASKGLIEIRETA